ncbi:SCO family protein [Aquibium sp. A9E412]|uniref:SCO family protein n=1 Tax=Aquibium sp. A9E412 TaxID=2976767 RepID=UPI0025B06005|nr:SCO family protein [Aquibium sp. A9E412]MDN2566030.1 SCO family protein [Aquibium sp. A9E412]
MIRRWLAILLVLVAAAPAAADPAGRPALAPRIGTAIDLAARFETADGRRASLRGLLDGRPALLVLGYNACRNMCGVTQQAVAAELQDSGLAPDGYRALFVSIDATEGPAEARAMRGKVAEATDAAGLSAWRFLTDGDGAGAALAETLGVTFERRPRTGEFAHPIAVFAFTPDGRLARVLPAATFRARDLRLALVEASQGRLGTLGDRVFLLCAGFDESKGRYTPVVWAAVQAGGLVTLGALGLGIVLMARRRRP